MADLRLGLLARIHDHWRPVALVLAAIVVLDVVAYVGFVRTMVRTSGDSEAILAKEQARVGGIRSEVSGLERVASKLACTRSDVERVFNETLSTKGERMTEVQRELRQLARARKIDPDAISYTANTVKDTGLVRFQISFPLDGAYATLEDFIKSVEASKNFLIVEDITMQASQGASLTLNIQLVTYFQAPDEESAAADARGGGHT